MTSSYLTQSVEKYCTPQNIQHKNKIKTQKILSNKLHPFFCINLDYKK